MDKNAPGGEGGTGETELTTYTGKRRSLRQQLCRERSSSSSFHPLNFRSEMYYIDRNEDGSRAGCMLAVNGVKGTPNIFDNFFKKEKEIASAGRSRGQNPSEKRG